MDETRIKQEMVERTVAFHGHMCPGLALGIRASEAVLREIGSHAQDEEVVAVVETDMCGVDAIQFLTGCTFGKGNLFHLDYGKNNFSFYRRSDGKGIRIAARAGALGYPDSEWETLVKKRGSGEMTAEEQEQLKHMQQERIKMILEAPLENLFEIADPERPMPLRARIMVSLSCEECGERVMETRVRRFAGKTLCIPCFEEHEKRH